jgi:hypothetical protein
MLLQSVLLLLERLPVQYPEIVDTQVQILLEIS